MHAIDVIRITALTAAVFNIILTILVLGRDYRSTLHRVYLLWGVAITMWNYAVYHLSQNIGYDEAFFWAKFCQLGVIFIPISLFHLAMIISKTNIPKIVWASYGISVCFALSLFDNLFIVGVRKLDIGYFSIPGPGFHIFTVFYVALITSFMAILYHKQKTAPPTQRTRMRALLVALIILWVFGTNDMMPIWGLAYYPLTHIPFYPMGSLAAIFYVVIIGYSVLQHQLLDIHVTLSRVAAQFVRLIFMAVVGFGPSGRRPPAPGSFSTFSFVASIGVLAASAAVASFFFPRFFGKGSDARNGRFWGTVLITMPGCGI